MGTRDELLAVLGPDGVARTSKLMASGADPTGYHVSSARVRELILACAVPRRLRRAAVAHLDATVLKGNPATVDCLLLGRAMGSLPDGIPSEHLATLVNALRDLNKLPFVSIKGRPVS